MTDEIRAQRAVIPLGNLEVEGFMLPDGSYRMSQTQVAESIELTRRNVSDFLRSKALKSLLGESYTSTIFDREEIEIESEPGKRGQSRFLSMPLEVVGIYWLWQAHRGNKQAFALCTALITESLERRFDRAFGVSRTEDDWNQRLSERIIAQLENDVASALAESDLSRHRERLLEQQLRDNGIEPWALPGNEEAL